jgi:hypothetical protein
LELVEENWESGDFFTQQGATESGTQVRSTTSDLRTDAIRTPGHRAGRSNYATEALMHLEAKRDT